MRKLKTLAITIKTQSRLDVMLERIHDLEERKLMFAAIRPYLRFDAIYDEPAPPITRDEFAALRDKYAQ